MANRPLLLTETFSGEGSWDEWISHFESVAAVNAWDGDAAKLRWLKVRLTGRAQRAFQHLTEESRGSYSRVKKALWERFDPDSRRELYAVELNTRRKRKGEGWADFTEDLQRLVDKAYPDLQQEAREYLALTSYLGQLSDPQVSFGIRQRRPKSVDEVVAATLELEAYAKTGPGRIAHVGCEEPTVVATVRDVNGDDLVEKLGELLQRVERLEADRQSAGSGVATGDRASDQLVPDSGEATGNCNRVRWSADSVARRVTTPEDVLCPDLDDISGDAEYGTYSIKEGGCVVKLFRQCRITNACCMM